MKLCKYIIALVLALTGIALLWLFTNASRGWGEYIEEIGNDYYYFSEERMIAQNPRNEDDPMIPGDILDYSVGDGFVIASRRGNLADEESLEYWVLDTNVPVVYGPMTENEFLEKRAKLGVPGSLSLK